MAKLNNKQKIEKYLKVDEHQIIAKQDIIIRIDNEDFNIPEEELLDISEDQSSGEELVGSLVIPGILDIEIVDDNDQVQLYFPFDINLAVPTNFEKAGGITTYYYSANDLICFATTKRSVADITILDKLFENRVKYIRGDMSKIVLAFYDQFESYGVKMFHVETILTLLYGEYTESGFTPTRLTTDANYSKESALNTKESAHRFNAGAGFNYGYTKDNVIDNITRTYETEKTDLEKIISGDFNNLKK